MRPKKFLEENRIIGVRVPLSKVDEFKEQVYKILNGYVEQRGVSLNSYNNLGLLPSGCLGIDVLGISGKVFKFFDECFYVRAYKRSRGYLRFETIEEVKMYLREYIIK